MAVPVADVVLQQHLVVVVGTPGVAVDAIGDGEISRPVGAAERRAESHAVDARAAVPVIGGGGDIVAEASIVAVEAPVAIHVGGIVGGDLGKIDGAEDVR